MMTPHPAKDVMKSGVGRFDTYFILRVVSDGCRVRPLWPSANMGMLDI